MYIEEKKIDDMPGSVKIESLEKVVEQSKKSVCKIKNKKGELGTGFFSLIPFPDKTFQLRTLITNSHILKKEILR